MGEMGGKKQKEAGREKTERVSLCTSGPTSWALSLQRSFELSAIQGTHVIP